MKSIAVVLPFVLVGLTEQTGFWGNRKVNCGVSVWSNWSATRTSDTRTRSRTVFRSPRNGGIACPSLTEEDNPTVPTEDISHQLDVHFKEFYAGDPGDNIAAAFENEAIFTSDWTTTKEKLVELIEALCGTIGRGITNNRIAIITFSSRVVLNFDFQTHWTFASVRQAIMNMPQAGGTTCTGDAFVYAHQYMFDTKKGVRSAAASVKEVLVLTDGDSNCGADLAESVQQLQVKAYVFALAIGDYDDAGKAEIESMVSRPLINHIFSVGNFVKFAEMVNKILTLPDKCVPFDLS